MPAATPSGNHQMPRTKPTAPAISQAARSGKYFIGTPTVSWTTFHYMRVVTQLPDSRKQHHRREQYRDHERCNFHISTPSPRGKYHTAGSWLTKDEAVF